MLSQLLKPIKAVFKSELQKFIHKDFHELVQRMTVIDTFLFLIVHFVDKLGVWHKLPVILGLLYLAIRRHLHQEYNLINVGRTPVGVRSNPVDFPYRTADGKYNDPFNEAVGARGSFFGRNMQTIDQSNKLLSPDPMVVATKLLARRKLIDTGKQFNMIAASWIQFMIHDWIDHLEDTKQVELVAPREVASECPLKSFKFFKTKQVPTGFFQNKTGSINVRTPWWDGSVLYGSNAETLGKVRTCKDGKLKIADDGLLLHDNDGVAISGDVRNSWAGVSTLQALFIKEHNAVCDALKKEDPDLEDEDLYRHARLVTSAVIAKVHTIDWTVELLKTDTLLAGMRGNWYGLLGKKFKDTFGHVGGAILGGLVGLKKPDNHGVPYSLTEEFTSVYRMHPLLPDDFHRRDVSVEPDHNKSPPLIETVPMGNMIGLKGEQASKEMGFTALLVSMGHQSSGALELWNYPVWLRDLIAHDMDGKDRPDHVDLAALEIYRDRERKIARYNDFRRGLFLIPISKWEDLTDDEEAIEVLRDVYNDDVESGNYHQVSLKEANSAANSSFRVYYGGATGAIPFRWESRPGTPKHTYSDTSIPPLTPPPSYYSSSHSTSKVSPKPTRFTSIFRKSRTASSFSFSSSSSSSSSFASWSSSRSSPSAFVRPKFFKHRRCFSNSPSLPFECSFDDNEGDEAVGSPDSPTSTLCFGGGSSSRRASLFRGCYRLVSVKNALLSIVGHGSASRGTH